ncbi:hypothetical protein QM180_11775, partial [Acinetobacter nosocomialis]|nr:hypothetical protein [Acinetobacter nosocomialis]
IGCAINFWCRLIHLKIILWNKPLEIGLCNKAVSMYKEIRGLDNLRKNISLCIRINCKMASEVSVQTLSSWKIF